MNVVKKFIDRKIYETIKLFDLKQFDSNEKLNSIAILLFMYAMSLALKLVIISIAFKVVDYSTLNSYLVFLINTVISIIVLATSYSSQCVKIAKCS